MKDTIQGRLRSLNDQARASGFSKLHFAHQAMASSLALILLFPAYPQNLIAQDQQAPAQAPSRPPYMEQTPEQLQQLVAPIALYPDSLVAQILAASTFPEQIVDADRWLQSHPDLKGEALAQAVDQPPWDPERQSTRRVSIGGWQHGQEPLLDVVSRRRLLQPGTGGDERRSSDAPPCARSGQSQLHAATKRNGGRFRFTDRGRQPRSYLCSGI